MVFNVHPNAKRVSVENVRLINRCDRRRGRSRESGDRDPRADDRERPGADASIRKVRILLVTGGPAVVAEALKTDKRAITAGPGNPPVVVDETADIELAGREIVRGASFDNNMVCTDEKETFVVDSKADELLRRDGAEKRRRGAQGLRAQTSSSEVIFEETRPAGEAGEDRSSLDRSERRQRSSPRSASRSDNDVRLLVAEVPREHNLVWTEQMMPVMPVVRVASNVDEGIDLAVRAEHGFRHTASIYSQATSTRSPGWRGR